MGIDLELRTKKWPTDKTLAVAIEVDPRTIRRDFEFMRKSPQRHPHVRGPVRVVNARDRRDARPAGRFPVRGS
jgi:hypothetical protein